ncbi:MAG TPA: hypothetical protein VGJ98_03945 [Candidatus Eisenbacteria bacterium]
MPQPFASKAAVHFAASLRTRALETGALAILLAVLLPSGRAGADLLLNEVFYDPENADEGFEFVELWNPDSVAVSLAGILLESGDGARPGTWTPIYAGAERDSVPSHGAFLIQGAALLDAIQNGPDAVRLSRAGVVLDLVGYGALAAAELFEGAPAADAPSGQSLARTRDGIDTGSNAADWAPEPSPTPGRANHPEERLTIARGSARLVPEVPWPGDAAVLHVTLRNSGRREILAARWRLEVAMRSAADGAGSAWSSVPVAICPGATIVPGESASARCVVSTPAPGRFDLRVILGDLGPEGVPSEPMIADTATVASRSTAGPLAVHEVAFRDRGAGEWVELLAREEVPDVGLFALSDAGGRAYAIDRGLIRRSARRGEVFVVAQSPGLVRASYALPESVVLGCRGGWAALNDTDGEDGFADRVRVVDSLGAPSDAVPYRSEYAEREGSIERLGAALPSASQNSWSESIDPRGGTPGRPNSMQVPPRDAAPAGGLLLAGSRVLRRLPGSSVAPLVLAFGEAARGHRIRVLVHDLLGRPRRRLVEGQRVQGEAAFVWDGRDDAGDPVPAGTYVVRAETMPDGSEPVRSGNLALTVLDR